jgi:hypothetical protein
MGVGQNGMIGTPQQAEVIILIRKYLCVSSYCPSSSHKFTEISHQIPPRLGVRSTPSVGAVDHPEVRGIRAGPGYKLGDAESGGKSR